MGNVYDCHSASRSSSWTWCFGEFTFNQESATTISETSVQCNQEIDQGSGRNPRNIRDRLARKSLEKDGFVDWLTGQFGYQQRKPTFLFRFSILYWAESVKFRKRMEGENRLVCQFIPMSRIASNRRRADGVPSGQISQDSLHCSFSPRSRTWWMKYSRNLSNSQDESSSCQCTTTLYGEEKETKNCP